MPPSRRAYAIASRLVAPEELAGLHEVAEILGVPKRTAARYVLRDDFPEPLDRLAAGPVWRRVDVEQWGRDYLPLPSGRPPQRGQVVEGDAAKPDECPICHTEVTATTTLGIATSGQTWSKPNQQEETCPTCGARLFRTVGEPWHATAPRANPGA